MAAPTAAQQYPRPDSGQRQEGGGYHGDAGRSAPATGRLTFEWQAGPAGFHVAPGVVVPADRLRTWTCPNCTVKHHGTLGQIVDQVVVVVLSAPGQPRTVWHGCKACEQHAPRPEPGKGDMALASHIPPRRGFDLRPDDGGPLFMAKLHDVSGLHFDLDAVLAGPHPPQWVEQLDQARDSNRNPDGTYKFRPITGVNPEPIVEQELTPFIPCMGCGRHWTYADPNCWRIVDEAGEVVFEGCQSCLVARLREKEEVAALRATLRATQVLLLEITDVHAWEADPHAMFERIRATTQELARIGG